MNGTAGNNTLKFLEVGGEYGWATFLDEVSVHYYIPENLENCTQSNCTQNTTDQNQTINNSTNSSAHYGPENLENCTQSNCTQNTTDQNQTINNSTNPNQIIVSPYINFSEPSQ